MVVHPGEIYPEDIFAFAQFRHAEDLFALQGPVGLDFDVAQFVIGIVEEETLGGDASANVDRADQCDHQSDLRENSQRATIAMPDRFARTHFDVEQMLLPPLAEAGDTAIPRARTLLAPHLPPRSLLARA